MKAKITFSVDLTNVSNKELTTWGTGNDADKLFTGVVPDTIADTETNTSNIAAAVRLTEDTEKANVYILEVKAELSDDSSPDEQNAPGHEAAWKAAVYASKGTSKTVTYSYRNKTASDTILGTSEVYFYTVSGNTAPESYNKASEGTSGATGVTQSLSVKVEDLINVSSGAMTDDKSAVTIGYLCVRYEGSTKVHKANSTYTVSLDSSVGA